MVHQTDAHAHRKTYVRRSKCNDSCSPKPPKDQTPTLGQINPDHWVHIRQKLLSEGFSADTVEIFLKSWRKGTKACYNPYLGKWVQFCQTRNISIFNPPITSSIHFLTQLRNEGKTTTQLCVARSALSTIIMTRDSCTWGNLPIVKRYMKGIYESNPVFPKSYMIWDVSQVFNYFRSLPQPVQLDLKTLTLKLAMLMALLAGGQRGQTIHSINVLDIKVVENILVIPIMSKIKQSKLGKHMEPLKFKAYKDPKLCIVTHLTRYLELTLPFRRTAKQAKLFLSLNRPHSSVTKDTVARWCKQVLSLSGIDITRYSSHSSRAAATSMAKQRGLSIDYIQRYAGWSNERTFAKFYDKPIHTNTVFQDSIL